jgi:hypothetical protein
MTDRNFPGVGFALAPKKKRPPLSADSRYSTRSMSEFASLKAQLRLEDISTTEAKKRAFLGACREYPPNIVKEYYTHCGREF